MLVSVYEYREDDVTDSIESEGGVEPDRDAEDYFGTEDLAADEGWERIERDGQSLLRREVDVTGVTAISVPRDDEPSGPNETGEDKNDLPGSPIMIRKDGTEHYLESAELIEAQDRDP